MTMHSPIAAIPRPMDMIDLIFCPGGDAERAERRRIMRARDTALLRATSDRSEGVCALYWEVVHSVQGWITSPASMEQLWQARCLATHLFRAAAVRERLEAIND